MPSPSLSSREEILEAAILKAEEMTRLWAKPKPTVDQWKVAQPYVRQALGFMVRECLASEGAEIVTKADWASASDES